MFHPKILFNSLLCALGTTLLVYACCIRYDVLLIVISFIVAPFIAHFVALKNVRIRGFQPGSFKIQQLATLIGFGTVICSFLMAWTQHYSFLTWGTLLFLYFRLISKSVKMKLNLIPAIVLTLIGTASFFLISIGEGMHFELFFGIWCGCIAVYPFFIGVKFVLKK